MSFEQQQISRWLAMSNTRAKRTVVTAVEDRVRRKECLQCGEKYTEGRRGLCPTCARKFQRHLNRLPHDQRVQEEERLIVSGVVLAVGQMKEIKDPNPFALKAS